MIPVVTVEEMQAIDASAPEPVEVLIERAGRAVARAALDLLGGSYGRRVVVLAGPGNNGADGRVAAKRLERRGVRTILVDATDSPPTVPPCDLVIDAAFGTGISRPYEPPDPGDALVLAVDVPSGLHGDTGRPIGKPLRADRTVTFAAMKPGLLLGRGPAWCGEVEVADIGLDVSGATIHVVDDASACALLPVRARDSHKWHAAVLVVGGSPGMTGAAAMAASAAQRAGAGMVQIAAPGVTVPIGPVEAVSVAVEEAGWADALIDGAIVDSSRLDAAVVGPGMGTAMATQHQIRQFVRRSSLPLVVDGDGLTALDGDAANVIDGRSNPTVLTPHDGEFARLAGGPPGDDRIRAVRQLASDTGAVVVSKGPTTVVAAPDGTVRLATAGDERLATAGTGDVLSGVIAALLANGSSALDAAALGAHLHGVAGSLGPRPGTIATDVIAALPAAFERVRRAGRGI
ncbi:MAG: NAD(P)H-hydrate dehydratase [Acidimicrobiales bacterium]